MRCRIAAGKIPGLALKTHDGTTCWQCEKCGKTRTGRGCMGCLEREVVALRLLVRAHALSDGDVVTKIVRLCHEIQDAGKRRKTDRRHRQ